MRDVYRKLLVKSMRDLLLTMALSALADRSQDTRKIIDDNELMDRFVYRRLAENAEDFRRTPSGEGGLCPEEERVRRAD